MPSKIKKSVRVDRKISAKAVHSSKTPPKPGPGPEAPPSKVARIVARMKHALKVKYKTLQKLLTSISTKDIFARYDAALIVKGVKGDKKKYGAHAVKQLQAALGKNEKSLYRWASVPEAFPLSALKKLVAKRDVDGDPLTWSHIELLAGVSSSKRDKLVERVLAEGMTVHDLNDAIEAGKSGKSEAGSETAKVSISRTLAKLTQRTEKIATDQTRWKELLAQLAEKAPSTKMVVELQKAKTAQTHLRSACDEILKGVDAALARVTPREVPATVPEPKVASR